MPNPLEDLTGKNVIVDDVPMPDRKVFELVAGSGVTLAASDDSVNGRTVVEISASAEGASTADLFLNASVVTATSALDWSLGNSQTITLAANTTFTFTSPGGPCGLTLRIVQGAGAYTVTWPASVKWAGGTAPVISTAAGAIDVIAFYFDGTTYYGSFLQAFA